MDPSEEREIDAVLARAVRGRPDGS